MSDNKIVSLITKEKSEKEEYNRDLLEIVDNFRKMVANGEVVEFATSSLDIEGEVVITTCCKDFIGGIGLLS